MLEIKINKVQWDNFTGKFVVFYKVWGKAFQYMPTYAVDEIDAFQKFKQYAEHKRGKNNVIWL
jgi:hypothetical protein